MIHFFFKLNFKPPEERKKRTRNRNVVWFNPPYSRNVATNIGRKFLRIIDESFPPTHALRKIFNRNTVKLSYSCMPNMKNIISAHNKHILNSVPQPTDTRSKECNYRHKEKCPLDGNCQASGIVYQATVTRDDTGYR